MEIRPIIKENWLTKKLPEKQFPLTLFLVLLLIFGTSLYLNNFLNGNEWMAATFYQVVKEKQYWRLWTAIFAHADLAHIMSNLFLFIPFSYFLTRTFSFWFFPLFAFFIGGLINLIVIMNLPEHSSIIGVSGVVYWMGAAWMTLSFLIDRRESLGSRLLKVSGVSIILFFPTTILAEVSYLSHALGYFFGILSGIIYYFVYRQEFRSVEIIEEIPIESSFDWENYSVENIHFEKVVPSDIPMIKDWIKLDHIARTFPVGESFFDVFENLILVNLNNSPIGLIEKKLIHKDAKILTIRAFIKDPRVIGRGVGSNIIEKFSDAMLFSEEFERINAYLKLDNPRSIRAFVKAGFKQVIKLELDGAPVLLMEKSH